MGLIYSVSDSTDSLSIEDKPKNDLWKEFKAAIGRAILGLFPFKSVFDLISLKYKASTQKYKKNPITTIISSFPIMKL